MSNLEKLSLDNVAKGAAAELFDREMEKILENIGDVNTKADAKRTITLKFTFQPDDARDNLAIGVQSEAKLAPVKAAVGNGYLGKAKNGKMKAFTHDPEQMQLEVDEPLSAVDESEAANA